MGPGSMGMQTQWYTYYVIVAQWLDPATHQMYTFRSDGLSRYPKKISKGSSISVLIDPHDPGRYLVEVK